MYTLVLSYEFPPAIGGVGYYTYGVTKSLYDISSDIVVMVPYVPGAKDFDKKEQFKIIRVSRILVMRELMMVIATFCLVRKYSIKRIFNSVWFPCGVISFLITRFINIPYFVTAHGSDILDDQNIQNKFKHFIRHNLPWLTPKKRYFLNTIFRFSRFPFESKEPSSPQALKLDKTNNLLNWLLQFSILRLKRFLWLLYWVSARTRWKYKFFRFPIEWKIWDWYARKKRIW
jgi:glycosyltransferase involved in cell wall biosynthesis